MTYPEQVIELSANTRPRKLGHDVYRVNVYANIPDVLYEGDLVTLTGEVIGVEGKVVGFQWQVDDGGTWTNVPGATAPAYSFRATQHNINLSWRLSITVHDQP